VGSRGRKFRSCRIRRVASVGSQSSERSFERRAFSFEGFLGEKLTSEIAFKDDLKVPARQLVRILQLANSLARLLLSDRLRTNTGNSPYSVTPELL
jgi:hypothetical protein